jgi:hypothetical protein
MWERNEEYRSLKKHDIQKRALFCSKYTYGRLKTLQIML